MAQGVGRIRGRGIQLASDFAGCDVPRVAVIDTERRRDQEEASFVVSADFCDLVGGEFFSVGLVGCGGHYRNL